MKLYHAQINCPFHFISFWYWQCFPFLYLGIFRGFFSSWYWRFPLLYFGIIDVFLCCILVLLRAQSEFLLWLGMSNLPSMRWEEGKLAEMLADWQKQNSSQLKQLRTLTVDKSWNANCDFEFLFLFANNLVDRWNANSAIVGTDDNDYHHHHHETKLIVVLMLMVMTRKWRWCQWWYCWFWQRSRSWGRDEVLMVQ